MRALLLTGVLSVLATGCSFTTAAGLDCETSADCGSDQMCTESICLPLCKDTPYGSDKPNAIRMGALLPIHTSTAANAGVDESDEQARNAAFLALEEVNQRTISGREIALYLCDTASDRKLTMKQATWLVDTKKVAAVLTAGSSQTLDAATVTVPKGVLTMSYSASSPELTVMPDTQDGSVGLVWRTSPSDAIQGSVIAHLLSNCFGPPSEVKVGILYLDDPYGQGLANIISDRLDPKVSKRTFSYPKRGNMNGVKSAVDQLDMYTPTVTVLIGFADDAAAILREASTRTNLMRENNRHRWFFSDSVKDAALLADSQAAAQAKGFYGTAPAQGTGLAFSTFQNRFQDKYKKDPASYAYTSNAYDAMYLLALGAVYSQSTTNTVTGPKMAEGLMRVSSGTNGTNTQLTNSNFTYLAAELAAGRSVDVEGASGQLDFDDKGEAFSPVELWQVGDTGFKTVSSKIEPSYCPPPLGDAR
ncbi:ABC transporter substrate-binding protein [Archangium sp.]|uniref:ABC transporter substrate-binding protein n=1 Tax=Archangium sp. TaxID=1872627 RepID=UPI002D291859|nr:ABC transporter substrate-binding protein [Archangium sp.]HYO51416.1 ABC transporter substrate-binding protein [Archangium sp.]